MENQSLQAALSQPLTKKDVQELAELAGTGKLQVQELLPLCSHKDTPAVAFRAAWVLESIASTFPDLFVPILPEFTKHLPQQQNHSCQRHFTNILLRCLKPKADALHKAAWLTITNREQVAETVFEWLIHPKVPVAVQVNCLEALLYLSEEFAWIKDELREQTAFYLKDGSAAMQSRGRRILKQLQ